jgi:hypothetical protein
VPTRAICRNAKLCRIIFILHRWHRLALRFSWALELFASRALTAALGATFKMPNIDIDPAALSRPTISTTPILPPKTISASAPSVAKISKALHVPPRIDLEPLYTALKAAIGDNWGTYKESISLFVMGSYIFPIPP